MLDVQAVIDTHGEVEAKERRLVDLFPGIVRIAPAFVYAAARKRLNEETTLMLVHNIRKARQRGQSVQNAVKATQWMSAKRFATDAQWKAIDAQVQEHHGKEEPLQLTALRTCVSTFSPVDAIDHGTVLYAWTSP